MMINACVKDRGRLINVIIKGVYVSLVVDSVRLAGSDSGNLRCRASPVTHYAVFATGHLVFCTILSPLSSLAALSFMVWQLYTNVAATSSFAFRREVESNIGYNSDFCYFALVGKNLVGQRHFARDIDVIIDLYVTDASY
ncbi:Uncharacterised protein [Yersinia intermedia]|nr:Uncharacterised protein [Yersinia intermedia]